MKYPIVIIDKTFLSFSDKEKPKIVFKEGLPYIKQFHYNVIDNDLRNYQLTNFKIKEKLGFWHPLRIKHFFRDVYLLEYDVIEDVTFNVFEFKTTLIKLIKKKREHFWDIDLDADEYISKIELSVDKEELKRIIFEIASCLKEFTFE